MPNQIVEFFKEGLRRLAPGWFIGLCRIAFGLMWLYSASGKVPLHFTLVGWLVFLFELCVGLGLLIGFLTRIFAALGLLMSLNLLIGLAANSVEARLAYAMMAVFHMLFITTQAGLNWGLDQILLEKLANSSLRRTATGRLLMRLL